MMIDADAKADALPVSVPPAVLKPRELWQIWRWAYAEKGLSETLANADKIGLLSLRE